jgi:hypothetical protein
VNASDVEPHGDAEDQADTDADADANKGLEAPEAEPEEKADSVDQKIQTGDVSGPGASGVLNADTVNQDYRIFERNQFQFWVDGSDAADDLRGLFGSASNQESPEVEVEDLLPAPDAEAHFKALANERLLILASTRYTGLTTAVNQRCKAFADKEALPAKRLLATSIKEFGKALRGIGEPTVLVLDISQNSAFQEELPKEAAQLRALLEQHSCHLVLAIEIEFRPGFRKTFPNTVFDLERIPPDRVFARHFQRPESEFSEVFESAYFRDIRRTAWPPLARTMAEVLNQADSGIAPEEFQQLLGSSLGNPSETIRNLLEQQLDPRGKAVLIAAAALEQLPASAIAAASDVLLATTRTDHVQQELFDEPGISQKLELIREDFNVEGSTFKNPDIGDEVLRHVWDQYPTWRESITKWLGELLLTPDHLELSRLPRRLVVLASAAEDDSMLKDQAKLILDSWPPTLWPFAPVLMLGGALDPVIGPGVRKRLYDWSRSDDSAYQWTALAACSHEDYLVRFPGNALFRLRQLTGSENEGIAKAAFEAIIDSTGHLRLTELLVHFHFWQVGSDQVDAGEIAEILDRICDKEEVVDRFKQDPLQLLDEPFGVTASFWRMLFEYADAASFRLATRAWLILAAELDGPDGERMVDLLVEPAAGDYRAIGQAAQAAKSLTLEGSYLSDRTRELALFMYNRVFEIEVPLL